MKFLIVFSAPYEMPEYSLIDRIFGESNNTLPYGYNPGPPHSIMYERNYAPSSYTQPPSYQPVTIKPTGDMFGLWKV